MFGDLLPQRFWGFYPETASFSDLHVGVIQTSRRLADGGGLVCLQQAPNLMAETAPSHCNGYK